MKKKVLYISAVIFAIACITLAFVNNTSYLLIMYPYKLLSMLVAALGKGNSFKDVLGWILYLALGLAPVAIPIVMIVRHKKVNVTDILWFIFTALHAFTLYVYINPMVFIKIPNVTEEFLDIAATGLSNASFLLLIVIFVLLIYKKINTNRNLAFKYTKLIIIISMFLVILCLFYSLPHNLYVSLLNSKNPNAGAEVSYRIIMFALSLIPFVPAVFVLNSLYKVINNMEEDLFIEDNLAKLHKLQKYMFLLAILPFVVSIAKNLVTFIYCNFLVSVKYSLDIDMLEIIVALLGSSLLVFINESYKIKEENELTI